MGKDVIIALDFDSKEKTLAFLDRFTGEKPFVKIGMELFYAEGPSIVREIKARGHKIFLDLKLHDIPNTVKKAMAVLSSLDVDMVNLHAAGTRAMMSAALEGLTRADGTRPMLIAVTQLTSTSQQSMEEEIGIHRPLEEVVIDYAKNARLAGSTAWSAPRLKPAASTRPARRTSSPSPPGIPLCRCKGGRSGAHHYARKGTRDRLGLHRRWPPHHAGGGSRRRLSPLRQRVCGLSNAPQHHLI